MNAANATAIKREKLRSDTRYWLAPVILVIAYPGFIDVFARAIGGYQKDGGLLYAAYSALSMLLAGSIPAVTARALILMGQERDAGSLLTRRMLYLMFAVSPLYVLTAQLAGLTGAGPHLLVIWTATWSAVGALLYFKKHGASLSEAGVEPNRLRSIHGGTAACLLAGFLVLHLANHVLAAWSVNLHGAVLDSLRLWYRSQWVEPVLLTLLLVMIATGIPMVLHHSRRRMDAFRIIQMATGVYVGLFLCAHLLAVLGARSNGVDTDWVFATGPKGLLEGREVLIPYYIYSTFFLVLHVACGLRIVLLKHGVAVRAANKAVYFTAGTGLVATASIAIAALGFHITL